MRKPLSGFHRFLSHKLTSKSHQAAHIYEEKLSLQNYSFLFSELAAILVCEQHPFFGTSV